MAGMNNSLDFDYSGLYKSLGILPADVPGESSYARTQPLGTANAHGYKPADVVRVTPEGLNVRSTQTVAVDPFTGNPIVASGAGNYAQKNANDVILDKPAPKLASSGTVNAATPLDISRLGLTVDLNDAPGVKAIDAAAPVNITVPLGQRPTGSAFTGGWGANGILKFEPAVTGIGPGWTEQEQFISPAPSVPGLVTGPRPSGSRVAAVMQQRAATPAPAPVTTISPEVHAALMAQQTDGYRTDQNGQTVIAMNGEPARANNFVDQFGMLR